MSNPLFQQMTGAANPMTQILQRFNSFKQTFRGDPRQQIQQMLNSGQVSQEQYNRAVQMAQQLQSLLK